MQSRLILTIYFLLYFPFVVKAEQSCSANVIYETLLKAPHTSDRLKAILKEVAEQNPGKSKRKILGIFYQKKKQFAESLRKQADAWANEHCNVSGSNAVAPAPASSETAHDVWDQRVIVVEPLKSGAYRAGGAEFSQTSLFQRLAAIASDQQSMTKNILLRGGPDVGFDSGSRLMGFLKNQNIHWDYVWSDGFATWSRDDQLAAYLLSVYAAVAKLPPPKARVYGTATLKLKIETTGEVSSSSIRESSGSSEVDQTALTMASALRSVPPIPPSLSAKPIVVNIPFKFSASDVPELARKGNIHIGLKRPPDITKSGLNDAFARAVMRALMHTMPELSGMHGLARIEIRLSERGDLADIQLLDLSAESAIVKRLLYAARHTEYPIPPVKSKNADRTFFITYTYEQQAPASPMSASQIATLKDKIKASLKNCWRPPNDAAVTPAIVSLHWSLKPDGNLDGEPRVSSAPDTYAGGVYADVAVNAVKCAAPFKLPPEAYSIWKVVDWTFDPRERL